MSHAYIKIIELHETNKQLIEKAMPQYRANLNIQHKMSIWRSLSLQAKTKTRNIHIFVETKPQDSPKIFPRVSKTTK